MILYCSNIIAVSNVVASLFRISNSRSVTLDSPKQAAKRSKFIERFQVSQEGLDVGVPMHFPSSLCPQDRIMQHVCNSPSGGSQHNHTSHIRHPLSNNETASGSKSSLTSNEGSDTSLGEMEPYLKFCIKQGRKSKAHLPIT